MSIINEDFNNFYNWQEFRIDVDHIYHEIDSLKSHYSSELLDILLMTLNVDEFRRIGLIKLQEAIRARGGMHLPQFGKEQRSRGGMEYQRPQDARSQPRAMRNQGRGVIGQPMSPPKRPKPSFDHSRQDRSFNNPRQEPSFDPPRQDRSFNLPRQQPSFNSPTRQPTQQRYDQAQGYASVSSSNLSLAWN